MGTVIGTLIILSGVGVIMIGGLDVRFFWITLGIIALAMLLRAQQKK